MLLISEKYYDIHVAKRDCFYLKVAGMAPKGFVDFKPLTGMIL